MGSTRVTFEIAADPPPRLDKALSRDVPEVAHLSRTRLARLIEEGAVAVNGAVIVEAKAKVAEGDMVEIAVPVAAQSHIGPQDIPLEIVFEDDHLLVVNKPAGMVVHPAPGSPSGTLVNALMHHCGDALSGVGGVKRPGIVHRIDKETSGLLVVARTDQAHQGLAAQFEAHSVERTYLALVHGVPEAGDPRLNGLRGVRIEGGTLKITTGIARHRTERQKQAVTFEGGKHAVTRARVLQSFGAPAGAALMECRLETGRTHQIRVHMAYVGHGLIGDPVYGGRRSLARRAFSETARAAAQEFARQALHAASLGFVHPESGKMMRFEADIPHDFKELLSELDV